MHLLNVRLILVLCFITAFGIAPVSAQQTEKEMQEKLEQKLEKDAELYKEFKSSEAFKEFQKKLRSHVPSGEVSVDFKLYQKTTNGLKNVTESFDEIFLLIQQYQCQTYGANPEIDHFFMGIYQYNFQTNVWDPDCISIELKSKERDYSGYAEWNPAPFPPESTIVGQTKTIELDDGYVLQAETSWRRKNSLKEEKKQAEKQTGTVIGTLTHFVPDSSKGISHTLEPLPNTEISIPEFDIAVDSDRHGNFVLRDIPADTMLKLTALSTYSETPDTLTFVAAQNQIIDMGKLILNLNN